MAAHNHRRRDNLLHNFNKNYNNLCNNNESGDGATTFAAGHDGQSSSEQIVFQDLQQRVHQERLHRHISNETRGELASCNRNLALEMVRVTESAVGMEPLTFCRFFFTRGGDERQKRICSLVDPLPYSLIKHYSPKQRCSRLADSLSSQCILLCVCS